MGVRKQWMGQEKLQVVLRSTGGGSTMLKLKCDE